MHPRSLIRLKPPPKIPNIHLQARHNPQQTPRKGQRGLLPMRSVLHREHPDLVCGRAGKEGFRRQCQWDGRVNGADYMGHRTALHAFFAISDGGP